MQKTSPIHRFIREIIRILESQNLKNHAHFLNHHPKTIKVTCGFSEFLSKHQNQFVPLIPS